jgi:anaerobic selenocysteine-containing dehydrogenase
MADIVLPGATFMERDNFKVRGDIIYMAPQVIPTVGQGWPTWKLWFELAKKMGYTKEFPWSSLDEAIDEHLKPVGMTAAELKANVNGYKRPGSREYKKYEKNGFETPTGKIEFSSLELQNAGYNPLPDYVNPYENETNQTLKSKYPYIMMSGGRIQYFYHSQHRNIPELLRKSPEPVIEINPSDARAKGISEGDLVKITSPRGGITAKALFVESLGNGIVGMTHGWNKSNINELTDDELLDPISGFPAYRGFLCNIEKV